MASNFLSAIKLKKVHTEERRETVDTNSLANVSDELKRKMTKRLEREQHQEVGQAFLDLEKRTSRVVARDVNSPTLEDERHRRGSETHDEEKCQQSIVAEERSGPPRYFHSFTACEKARLQEAMTLEDVSDRTPGREVTMWKISMPEAKQTHEIVYMHEARALFATQLTSSMLVKIGISPDGRLSDAPSDVDFCGFSRGLATEPSQSLNGVFPNALVAGGCQPHNVSASHLHPHCFYLSLQVPNVVYMLDSTKWVDDDNFTSECYDLEELSAGGRYGTPHVVRERNQADGRGELWIGLKGSKAANPVGMRTPDQVCPCCDDNELKSDYRKMRNLDVPTDYGVCRIPVEKRATHHRCTLDLISPCGKSPPMLDFNDDYTFVCQDGCPQLYRINRQFEGKQLDVPFPDASGLIPFQAPASRDFTGPGIATTPDGKVTWCALLGHQASLLRVTQDGRKTTLNLWQFRELRVESKKGEEPREFRFIHMDFARSKNMMFLLSSTLLEPDNAEVEQSKIHAPGRVVDAIVMLLFDDEWDTIQKVRVLPLPVQQCQCHRILLATVGDAERECLFVTLFSTSGILQICDLEDIALDDFDDVKYGFDRTQIKTSE